MSAQGLLHSVFSCSSPAAKSSSKRKLRQTRSLDPALIRNYGSSDAEPGPPPECAACSRDASGALCSAQSFSDCLSSSRLELRGKAPRFKPSSFSSPSTPLQVSPSAAFHFDYDVRAAKRGAPWELSFLARSPAITPPGSTSSIFSPRRWLQRKLQGSGAQPCAAWRSEGDFTWSSMSGRSVRLQPVPIQSLSELERVRLQEVAFSRLLQDYDLGCQITIPKDGQKRKKSLRRKLDSLAKEKNKDKEFVPQAFGMPLSQVIANDRTHKQRQDSHKEEHKDATDLVSSILQFATKRPNKELSSSNSSVSSTSETPNESTSPNTPEAAPRARRRGAMSVDSITDLDDNQSRLLEALQLSLPAEAPSKKEKQRDKKLSLNPIYRQVPRLVDSCCQHLEKYGLQTVGIFRVGSSKKRVRQLREEFDRGVDVQLDEEHSVHDVAALLKEFLRDMPDPLLTRELYTAFINTVLLEYEEQQGAMQLLIYLLPPCNSDTLYRLLHFLSTVAAHADDTHDKDGQEVTGNKMTSLNLATIFGPNLLHKQKSSDKEFSVQSSARAEESTAIIAVVERMIATYQHLFMVPPDLQNEVLMSLLETDPDVVDYLLRRKASQCTNPDLLRSSGTFSLSERHSSSDSNKASSGEVSPYDNNSPVLPDRLLAQPLGEERLVGVPEQSSPTGHVASRSREPHLTQWVTKDSSDEHTNIWGAWHATLKSGLKDLPCTGSQGSMSECSSSEGLDGHQGNGKQQMRRAQTALGLARCRQHPPVTRALSSPQDKTGCGRLGSAPPPSQLDGQSASSSTEDLPQRGSHPASSLCGLQPHHGKTELASSPPGSSVPNSHQCPPKGGSPGPLRAPPTCTTDTKGSDSSEWQEWQRERWQIWQLLSSDNTDTLPETLV
ncbi:rho GTPase-activating protein 6-like isoform X1 [Scleropages formosus]|nr:rho GTPase-activating protein 6-like isoform X1 [Scleropages formosus]